ncbi:hypothetical protein [Fonticella tunisiensis]|uniref:Uncharacterized protein n=1 Tax=Fonticella tunisiensis TaxID=1096341 RepID=A0A4R7KPE5_9CLOT|nr:hypothetical protein [Fonticella tunisiensis]TDT58456.1 hypothetical protein EDD71_111107 [Fonticella tunisiensis]
MQIKKPARAGTMESNDIYIISTAKGRWSRNKPRRKAKGNKSDDYDNRGA